MVMMQHQAEVCENSSPETLPSKDLVSVWPEVLGKVLIIKGELRVQL